MTKKILLTVMALASAGAFGQSVYIPKSMTLYEGGNELLSRFSYFSSKTRVNQDGETVDFLEGESFSMMDLDVQGAYGLTSNLQVTLGLSFRMNQSTVLFNGDKYNLTASGAKSGLVQLKYGFPTEDRFQLGLEVNYEPSLFTNEEYEVGTEPEKLALGDDGTSTSFGASFTLSSKTNNHLSGRVLYRNPSSNLSSEVYSEVEGALVWTKFALIAGFENVTSLSQDAYSDDPENKPAINSGSSYMFNGVNRSWMAPYLGANFAIGQNWRLEGRYQSRISGASTDLGDAFVVTLARRISKTNSFQKKNQAFKEYTVEGTVTKVSKSGKSALIDVGMEDGLKKGSRIDFYHFDYLDGNELIAAGVIVKLAAGKALVKITTRYSKKRVEDGTLARGGLISNNP